MILGSDWERGLGVFDGMGWDMMDKVTVILSFMKESGKTVYIYICIANFNSPQTQGFLSFAYIDSSIYI